MSAVIAKLVLDTLIIVLLALTISYCWLLNRRIKILQDSKSELALLLRHFDESTQRASESIVALQSASKKISENIQLRVEKANYMLDDLSFLIDKGNKLADQLEASFAVSRARNRVNAEQSMPQDNQPAVAEKHVPVIEKPPREPKAEPEVSASARQKTTASLSAVLEKMVGRSAKPAAAANDQRATPSPSRSKAEQELLEMLRAGMKG